MHVTKRLDLPLLETELAAAGVPFAGLGTTGTLEAGDYVLFTFAGGAPDELPPEAVPVVQAHDASKPQRTRAFEDAEDAERLAIVAERARIDPAFAALAELTLREKG